MPKVSVEKLGENDEIEIGDQRYKVERVTVHGHGVWLKLRTPGDSTRFKRFNPGTKLFKF